MITYSKLGEMGRLGNQLFQIASGIGIAHRNSDNFVLVKKWEYQKHFKNPLPMAYPSYLSRVIEKEPYYTEYSLSKDTNWDLFGYFQSWKYFDQCKSTIYYYFDFDRESYDGVAVHVRRGDYLNLQHVHPVLPISYYISAMEQFNGESFTIFSDDIDWCKSNINGSNIKYHQTGVDIEDLKIMSGFSKFIIANSSFSWWAAYLSRGEKVIAPNNYVIGEYKDDRIPSWWHKL